MLGHGSSSRGREEGGADLAEGWHVGRARGRRRWEGGGSCSGRCGGGEILLGGLAEKVDLARAAARRRGRRRRLEAGSAREQNERWARVLARGRRCLSPPTHLCVFRSSDRKLSGWLRFVVWRNPWEYLWMVLLAGNESIGSIVCI
jgi:hypothetical protein